MKEILSSAFRRAYSDGIITANPMAKIENYKVVLAEPDPFTKIDTLIAPNKDSAIEILLIIVDIATGLRISDLLALTKEAFNKAKATLTVDLALVDGIFKCTQTAGSDRILKLTDQGVKAMC
ncbi:MAG: hypothetical protein HRU22_13390 [Gammaproteobacteria bacterium]|nr:hypothetical protein [Gammaproteobacteria bacterium]